MVIYIVHSAVILSNIVLGVFEMTFPKSARILCALFANTVGDLFNFNHFCKRI